MSGKGGSTNALPNQGMAIPGVVSDQGNYNMFSGTYSPKPATTEGASGSPQDRSMNGMRMFQAYRNGANMGQINAMNQPALRQQQFLPPAMARYTPGPTPQQIAAQNQQAAMQALQAQQYQNWTQPSNPQDQGGL